MNNSQKYSYRLCTASYCISVDLSLISIVQRRNVGGLQAPTYRSFSTNGAGKECGDRRVVVHNPEIWYLPPYIY